MALQDFAFEIVAHAARTMTAGQQQAVERRRIDGIPAQRRDIAAIGDRAGVGLPRIAVPAHQKSHEGQIPQ